MGKIEDARFFLEQVGMPQKQQSDICCYTLLAMAQVAPYTDWADATNEWIRIHDIIRFTERFYQVAYAENSRETFRKQALHPFRTAAIVEDNGMSTNSPNYRYRITSETLDLLKTIGRSDAWADAIDRYLAYHEKLTDIYASKKEMTMIPVRVGDAELRFSAGKHNELQKAIIEEFAPRFAPDSECLYVGDTTQRDLLKDEECLRALGFEITLHDKMPDIVLYLQDRDWLYFIEAVTSVGPMSPERIIEIEDMTKNVSSGKIYVTAFLDFHTYKRFSDSIAWDTEVWVAEEPDHLIHLNGDRFIGPR